MALPKQFHKDIQFHPTHKKYFIYFIHKDIDPTFDTGCGYYAVTRNRLIRECSLKSLDKFDLKKPYRWSDVKAIKLKIS